MSSPGSWRLEVLGKPRLVGPGGQASRPERVALALMTYLTLEGPTPRSRLAGLLWPETPEGAARNNLVHLIRRVNRMYGGALLRAADDVELGEGVDRDVQTVRGAVELAGETAGQLLDGLEFDDRPDFADWLLVWRERLDGVRAERLVRTAAQQEAAGDLEGALLSATRLLEWHPASEEVHRRLMRLHYLTGDRGAALSAFERCRAVLRREFGAEPSPETVALAREVERGTATFPPSRPRIPLRVLRPPSLIGREGEWAQLHEAWAAGQVLFLTGEGGVGKSRLARDFAASKGEALHLEARPGDALVPYATVVRSLRRIFARTPDLPLAPWMRVSLARLLPEFLDGTAGASGDEAHLHAAVEFSFRAGLRGVEAVVLDDLHLADRASVELLVVLISSAFPLGQSGGVPGLICTARPDELPPFTGDAVRQLVVTGRGARLDLRPLVTEAVEALLRELDVPATAAMGPQLARFTGGNPLFLLETVKHILEAPPEDGRLPVAARVSQLIGDRLARLSPAALSAARGAAVLQSDVQIELVAAVLGAPLLETAGAWEELEAAQVMAGERFSHDLVQEAVLAGLPPSVRRLLNRSAARVLEQHGAAPSRVALHWDAGGEARQSATWFVRAAEAALGSFRLREAVAFFLRAADAHQALHNAGAAFGARGRAVQALLHLSDRTATQAALDDLHARAQTPEQWAQVQLLQAELHVRGQEGVEAERAARAGLDALGDAQAPLRAHLMVVLASALTAQGRAQEAVLGLREAVAALEALGPSTALALAHSDLAAALDRQDQHAEASGSHARACTLLEVLNDQPNLAVALRAFSDNQFDLGYVREGLQHVTRAFELEAGADAATWGTSEGHVGLAQAYMDLGAFGRALTQFERAIEADTDLSAWRRAYHGLCLGELLLLLGDLERAEGLITAARDRPDMPGRYRSRAYVAWAALPGTDLAARREALAQAERLQRGDPRPLSQLRVLLAQATVEPAARAHELAQGALALARAHQLGGFEVSALTRTAQTALHLGLPLEAQEHAQGAVALLSTREPAEMTRGEVYWTQFQVWRALDRPEAPVALEAASEWVRHTATAQVPEHHREGFLQRNGLVRDIRTAAEQAGR